MFRLCQVFEGLPKEFAEDQDTVVRYMKLLPPVFSDEDRRAEAAKVSHWGILGGWIGQCFGIFRTQARRSRVNILLRKSSIFTFLFVFLYVLTVSSRYYPSSFQQHGDITS